MLNSPQVAPTVVADLVLIHLPWSTPRLMLSLIVKHERRSLLVFPSRWYSCSPSGWLLGTNKIILSRLIFME